jgi:hypothetical protein
LSERLARIEARFDTVDARLNGLEARLSLLERVMLWGFTINATLSLAILARVLLQ